MCPVGPGVPAGGRCGCGHGLGGMETTPVCPLDHRTTVPEKGQNLPADPHLIPKCMRPQHGKVQSTGAAARRRHLRGFLLPAFPSVFPPFDLYDVVFGLLGLTYRSNGLLSKQTLLNRKSHLEEHSSAGITCFK